MQQYKFNFEKIHNVEIYKWKAVKIFLDNWDIQAYDFHDMLSHSLLESRNLLSSGNYFPKRMLLQNSKVSPREVQELFTYLYDEDFDLYERITFFKNEFLKISKRNFPNAVNTYQDHRAISVYLNLRYPERYYLYKFDMFKSFIHKIEYNYKPVAGRDENLGQYHRLCDLINYEISNDQELLKLHKERIKEDCYFDKKLHILTQDLIYAVSRHLSTTISSATRMLSIRNKPRVTSSFELSTTEQVPSLKPSLVNYLENAEENKRLGDKGEQWVLSYERDRLIDAGKEKLASKIRHIASEKGDGAGFDIESFNEDGSIKFIEVKTTKGKFAQPFYITRSELEKSRQEKQSYSLYRVYDYDESTDTAKLEIIEGDLSQLCNYPALFRVTLKG